MTFLQRLLKPGRFVAAVLFALFLGPAPAAAQDASVPCRAEPTDMTFSYGQMVRCRLDVAGDSDLFRFSGSAGDVIVLLTIRTETTIVPCIELTAPNGAQTSACGFAASNRISTTLTLTGSYTVRVRDFDFSRTGEYQLTLERIVPPLLSRTINYGETVPDALDLIGDLDLFTFNGTTGDDVTITVTRLVATLVPCLELSSPSGVRTTACGFSATNQIRTTLSQTGIHTILIRDFDYSRLGGYTVTAQCLIGVCTSSLPPTAANDAYSTAANTSLVIDAPGVLANDNSNGGGAMTAVLVSTVSHGSLALGTNGGFTYTPASGFSGLDTFSYRAQNATGPGNTATVTLTVTTFPLPTAVDDAYSTAANTPLNPAAPGVLGNDNANGGGAMSAALVTTTSHGALALNASGGFSYVPALDFVGSDSFTYRAANAGGTSNIATVTINVTAPTSVQPPRNLKVVATSGLSVKLRWEPPLFGPAPTGYVLKGGLAPGQVVAWIPTGSTATIFTFLAPSGSFYIRMHSLLGAAESGPSNEVALHVSVPVPPSPPTNLLGVANGSSLALAWKNTFEGGPPSHIILDVTGSFTGSFTVGAVETFTFPTVPAGTYTFAVRASNAGGTSAPSNAVTLTFPSSCPGPPDEPVNFIAYKLGTTIYVEWDPPATGPAPTSYVLNVTGGFVGSIATGGRSLSGRVGPGSYGLSVQAVNPCGASAFTTEQIVVVP